MEIVDNNDVTSWVCESLSAKPNKIPLYVTTYPLNELEDEHPIGCSSPSPTVAIRENDDILGDEQPSQVLQDNAQISGASIDVSFEFTDDYHDNTHFDNVQSNDVNFNLSSSRRNKRKSIQDYDNIANLNIDGDIMVGQLYSSKKELQKQLAMIAMRKNYEFKVERSTKDRLEIRCVDGNCKWRLRATKLQVSEFFEVRKFETSCMYHVVGNMRNKFADDETMFKLYYIAAKIYFVSMFNSVMIDIWAIKDGKDARKLPIFALADHLRGILQEWFNVRWITASSWNSTLTKWAEEKVHKNQNRGLRMSVLHEADLYHIVHLNAKSCTCRRFDLDQLPLYTMCSKFYTANAIVLAYAEPIWPDEERIVKKCSRCGRTSHNRQTCKNPIRLHSST
ncbi:unnamed protein product [Malus baccata var. baccata]